MIAAPATLTLRVVDTCQLNPLIRQLRLQAQDGAALPGYSAGAHIRVQVRLPDGASDWRHYSLINLSSDVDTGTTVNEYRIAVRLEEQGHGGSKFMHRGVNVGDLLTIEIPKNDFPLDHGPRCAVLLAGGIGITPLVSMAVQRVREHAPWRMVYAGRSRDVMAFLPELQALGGDALHIHADLEQNAMLDVNLLLDGCGPQDHLYVCGPKPMLDTVLAAAHARGWGHDRVHFELFSTPVVEAGDHAFEVMLAQSGRSITVPANQSILDALIEAGVDPMFDCKRGECGVCAVAVIEGEIDHRDYVLSNSEKATGNVMQVCVSRCRGPRLVLDL